MADEHNYQFVCEALQKLIGAENTVVTRWSGTEGVSKLYRYEIVLAVKDSSVSLESLLNMPATLTAKVPDGIMKWHGIITQASQEGHDDVYDFYKIVLEPRLARLRAWRWSDIYLDQQLDNIIVSLLDYAQLKQSYVSDDKAYDYRILATGMPNTKQEFTCQFEESCLDFLMRKLEYYGVYFWFEQGDTQESVVFANDVDQQPQDAINAVHYARGTLDTESQNIAITRLDRHVGMPVDTVTLHDSPNYSNTVIDLTASVDLTASQTPPPQLLGEYHSYSQHFTSVDSNDSTSGAALANWRAQELLCASQHIKGQVRTPGITSGYLLTVQEHGRSAPSNDYYVIQISHEGYQTLETSRKNDEPPYRGSFIALPRWTTSEAGQKPLQFRPQRTTPLPRIMYMVNGFIDTETPGNTKLYAQPDDKGRYQVRFCFVRKLNGGGKNSAWLRMATPYAGGSTVADPAFSPPLSDAGMHFPLREGTEVLISFLNGDPDRPVIMSALPNVEAPSVVTSGNAYEHLITTAGGNTLALRDSNEMTSILLSTPTDAASLNLGKTDDPDVADGFHLKTEGHGEIHADSSMLIEVPGHLRIAAGGGALGGFLSTLNQNTPAWMTISQSGGVVISNYVGANFQNTAGITVQNFIGGKLDFVEALSSDVFLGVKRSLTVGSAKEYTYPKKVAVHDTSDVTFVKGTRKGLSWTSTVVTREDNSTTSAVNAIASYKLLSPSISFNSGAVLPDGTAGPSVGTEGKLGLELTGSTLTGGTTQISSVTATKISSITKVSMTAGTTSMTATAASLEASAASLLFKATASVALESDAVAEIKGMTIKLG